MDTPHFSLLRRLLLPCLTLPHFFLVPALKTVNVAQGPRPAFAAAEALYQLLATATVTISHAVWPIAVQLLTMVVETLSAQCLLLLHHSPAAKALLNLVGIVCERRVLSEAGPALSVDKDRSTSEAPASESSTVTGAHQGGAAWAVSDAAFEARPDLAPQLLMGLLHCACGLTPSHTLADVVNAFRSVGQSYGVETLCRWLAQVMDAPDFMRASVQPAAKTKFLADVAKNTTEQQWSRLKMTIKNFCFGKKKGTAGTPSKAALAETDDGFGGADAHAMEDFGSEAGSGDLRV